MSHSQQVKLAQAEIRHTSFLTVGVSGDMSAEWYLVAH